MVGSEERDGLIAFLPGVTQEEEAHATMQTCQRLHHSYLKLQGYTAHDKTAPSIKWHKGTSLPWPQRIPMQLHYFILFFSTFNYTRKPIQPSALYALLQ